MESSSPRSSILKSRFSSSDKRIHTLGIVEHPCRIGTFRRVFLCSRNVDLRKGPMPSCPICFLACCSTCILPKLSGRPSAPGPFCRPWSGISALASWIGALPFLGSRLVSIVGIPFAVFLSSLPTNRNGGGDYLRHPDGTPDQGEQQDDWVNHSSYKPAPW